MGYQQCLPLSVVQLKGKHCLKPHCRIGVVDTFGQRGQLENHKVGTLTCVTDMEIHFFFKDHSKSNQEVSILATLP